MISVIIINFRQRKYTEDCINSIYDTFKISAFEVIIVNNSPEESLDHLEKKYPDLKIIENENKGFSQANNKGAKSANGKYLFFLNADTLIKSDFLESFNEKFKNTEFGAVGLKLRNPDNTFQLSFWKENNFLNEIKNKSSEDKFRNKDQGYSSAIENEYSGVTEVDWVTGAAMIIRKDIFDIENGFDEDYFLFYEDADICKRFSDAGLKNYFFPESEIIHYKGENVNSAFESSTYYYSKESQLLYYKKHNNLLNNLSLRVYLFIKFFLKYIFTFKKINLKIFLLSAGIKIK